MAYDLAALPVHRVPRALTAKEADELVGAVVPDAPANVTDAGLYVDAETGDPFLAYYPMPREATAPLRAAVTQINYSETLRAATGLRNRSRTFGMAPRRPTHQRESCRPAGMATEQPEVHAVIVALADRLAADLKAFLPERAVADAETVAEVDPSWRLSEQALWTSGVVNKTSTLPFHRDAFNFKAWSAMPVLRRAMDGGYLALPEYDAVVACRDGWVLYFPGWELVHGVTPLRARAEDAYRYSVVYYALKGMKDCFSYAVEVGESRRRRTEREQGMADEVEGRAEPKVRKLPIGRAADMAQFGRSGRPDGE